MLKVAVVGCGGISGVHVPAWESFEDCELVAICDVRPEMMDKYPGKRCYTDYKELLENEELDIVDICLPTYLHADYSIMAMEKGINVVCEKPISLDRADVERVYKCAEKNNVKFMVAHVIRFWPEYKFVKEIFDNQTYGKLLSGSMYRLGGFPKWTWDNWMSDEKRSGLTPYDLHIHDLDYMVYAFGKPNNAVTHRSKLPNQDYIHAVYEYDGFFLTGEASWYASCYPFGMRFRFQFEKAVIAMEHEGLKVFTDDGQIISVTGGGAEESGTINLPATNAYADELEYFKNCVIENKNADIVKPEELECVIDILNSF